MSCFKAGLTLTNEYQYSAIKWILVRVGNIYLQITEKFTSNDHLSYMYQFMI